MQRTRRCKLLSHTHQIIPWFLAPAFFAFRATKNAETATTKTRILHEENSGIEGEGVTVVVGLSEGEGDGFGEDDKVGVNVGAISPIVK